MRLIKRPQFLFIVSGLIFLLPLQALFSQGSFGYISYSTTNIGDDIQAIAAKRFLPSNSLNIDREFIAEFEHHSSVSTIVNGWFSHTSELPWYRPDIQPPKILWPPASCIDPLLISMHISPNFLSLAFSKESIKYMKKHGPVGARDHYTLAKLRQAGVSSYHSGCLTLTLENDYKGERDNVIYAVDIPESCLRYLKRKAKCPVIEVTHNVPNGLFL